MLWFFIFKLGQFLPSNVTFGATIKGNYRLAITLSIYTPCNNLWYVIAVHKSPKKL